MNPISVALKGKGPFNLLRRGARIARRYGATPGKMSQALAQFASILKQFECGATFPVTAIALQRNPRLFAEHQAQGIEFAVHGYRHIDHSQLAQVEQLDQLALAQRAFHEAGIQAHGFRCPYLRWNPDTVLALQSQGFAYDSSQGLAWDILKGRETPAYRHVVSFYGALSAQDYPSLPRLEKDLVRIPYSLPDDEALVERLALDTPAQMSDLWLAILRRTYELGELFTVGLHPERVNLCKKPLMDVLGHARSLAPSVWIARLDEIAAWWRKRTETVVKITNIAEGKFHLTAVGPGGITVLARNVQVNAPTAPWANRYRQVGATIFTFQSTIRPLIGLAPAASPRLADLLRQQGYLVETSQDRYRYSYYFDQTEFSAEHERPVLAQLETTGQPLIRLGRWPNGARSALSVTGDIDALTLWDYGLRFLGR